MNNVRNHYGLPCVVSINHFTFDTDAEVELLKKKMAPHEVPVVLATHWADGGEGAADVAKTVVELIEKGGNRVQVRLRGRRCRCGTRSRRSRPRSTARPTSRPTRKVRAQIKQLQDDGYGHYPVCVAKTQYSFSTDRGSARRAVGHMSSTSAKCGSPPARSSSSWSAATS